MAQVKDPKVLAFLQDLVGVCQKHGGCITGDFTVWLLGEKPHIGAHDVSDIDASGFALYHNSLGDCTENSHGHTIKRDVET